MRRQRKVGQEISFAQHASRLGQGSAVDTVESVLARAKYRSEHRENLDVNRVSDLQIHFSDQDSNHRDAGYYATIDGRDMKLSDTAFRGANRLIGQKNLRFWTGFSDKNAFPKSLVDVLDNRPNSRLTVRHDGLEVNAILPSNYQIKDAHEILEDVLPAISERMGDIKGISAIEEGSGDNCSYRIIVDGNIVESLKPEMGQYMMFMINTSETGFVDTKSIIGMFRGICTNSTIRINTMSKWNHLGDYGQFFDGTGRVIQQTSYYRDSFSKIFGELLSAPLGMPMSDLLNAMVEGNLISRGHYDAAMLYANGQTEDGRDHETQYDAFNLLTRSAQDLPNLSWRVRAEESALAIFTDSGGLAERLRVGLRPMASRAGTAPAVAVEDEDAE